MLWPACPAAFSRCRRCLRVSRTPATLTSAAALRSGRGSEPRIAFQGRMVVDPRLGTNHPAEVGAGSDRPVMRACRSGSEHSDWKERNQSRRAIGIVPDHSSRTCSDLAIPSVQIIPQPCGLGRILFSECATFCYFVLATLKRDSRIRDWFPRSRVRDTPCWIRRQPSPSRLAISLML